MKPKAHHAKPRKWRKKHSAYCGGVALLVALPVIALLTFNINRHRGEIEAALSKETGRLVKLGGDIHIGLSRSGLALSVNGAAFGNPSWASRPEMARIGHCDIAVDLFALLSHKISIGGLAIEDADILLESAGDGRHNWEMQVTGNGAPKTKADPGEPVSINVTDLSIKHSRIGLRGPDGKVTVFNADKLTLGSESGGIGLHFAGDLNGLPITLAAKSNTAPLTSSASRPLSVQLSFANYTLSADGQADFGKQTADFDKYEFASGDSKLDGKVKFYWGGARPAMQGNVSSEKIVPADLVLQSASSQEKAVTAAQQTAPRVFSAEPLDLSPLKAADMNIGFKIDGVPAGSVELHDVTGKLVVNNGHLLISPLHMGLGEGTISGEVNLDSGLSPPQIGTNFSAADINLGDFIKLWGLESFLTGKARGDFNFVTSGHSLHEWASNLSGPFNLVGAGGDVISSTSDKLWAGISDIFAPGSGNANESMNCLVARFIARDGVLRSNGILVDTSAATAAGYGDVDLRGEVLNLDFHVRPKLVDISSFLPSIRVGGTLEKPSVGADPNSIARNVGNLLSGGSANDGVPDLFTQQGQNACAYTLDHHGAATVQNKPGLVPALADKASGLLKNFLGQ